VDRNRILVGEPVQLTLEADLPPGLTAGWQVPDSIPHFEFIRKGNLDSVETSSGKTYKQILTITSFDSGLVVLPPLVMIAGNKKLYTDSIRIEVSYSPFDPKQDYHDIKDIIALDNPNVHYIIWIVLAISLVSIFLVIFFIRKKESTQESKQEIAAKRTPYEEAIQALEELRKQQLPEKGQVKLYYTRLNDILRLFVLKKLKMATMEKTNEELIMQLRQMKFSAAQFSQLAGSLRMSDFVKFAKYQPMQQDNEKNFQVIESSVQILNEMEE
jgi:hypothetical protein